MRVRTAVLPPALAVLAALTTTACGSAEKKEAGTGGLVKVNLAAMAIGQTATIVAAKEQGIFEKHGIDLEISYVEPAALVPALMSGDADFVWTNAPALLAARANNVPLKSVTTVSIAGDDPASFPIQVMVPKDSDIKSLKDLGGKEVGTASLFQLNDLALMESLDQAGVDAQSVKFVEIPFPNMGEALKAGRADAIIATEPFTTIMKSKGEVVPLVSVSEGLSPTTSISSIASSDKFIGANSELIEDFRAAVDEAADYAVTHDDEVRATIPKMTELTPELSEVISLAPVDTTDDPAAWNAWAELLVEVGVLDKKVDSADAFLAD
ncbi:MULTISPECIES: ABC transporter substrate-binding protein [unclassified Streptomyces]|uniref:ABC transporter substrate-binding protein n=1 Tax=unclassified Streptomyces TaxID=2593676 RepID=UPI0035E342A4